MAPLVTLVIGLLCFGGACFGLGALLVMYAVFGWDVWIGEDEAPLAVDAQWGRIARDTGLSATSVLSNATRLSEAMGKATTLTTPRAAMPDDSGDNVTWTST